MNENEIFQDKKGSKKKIAIIVIIVCLVVSVAGFTGYKVYTNMQQKEQERILQEEKIKQLEAEKAEQAEKERKLEESKKAAKEKEESQNDKNKVNIGEWENLHNMINTLIVSEDVWGKKEITKEEVTRVKALFEGKDETITNYLTEWQNLDFSHSVEFHNYVWDKLGGTVGRADDVDAGGIEAAKVAMQ